MGFSVKGDYFEACSCDMSCPCIWLGPATQEACDLLLAWHVSTGEMDGVDLSGLNAVMAVRTSKQMTDGNWKVALYLDERSSPEQSAAMAAVFSGGAGGHLAALGPLIGEVVGVAPASISFDRSGRSMSASVGEMVRMSAEEIVGMDGSNPPVISNPLLGVVAQPVTQARAGEVSYHDHWDADFSGTNSFITEFAYDG